MKKRLAILATIFGISSFLLWYNKNAIQDRIDDLLNYLEYGHTESENDNA